MLKGTQSIEASQVLSIKTQQKIHSQHFFSPYLWSVSFKINIQSYQNLAVGTAILFGSLCLWQHEQGQHLWQCPLPHRPIFFCSSLVRKGSKWLHPEELNFKANKNLSCMTVGETTTPSLQTVILAHFLHVLASLHRSLLSPLNANTAMLGL